MKVNLKLKTSISLIILCNSMEDEQLEELFIYLKGFDILLQLSFGKKNKK